MEALVLWLRVTKYVLWQAEERWKARSWELSFGGKNDNEYLLRLLYGPTTLATVRQQNRDRRAW